MRKISVFILISVTNPIFLKLSRDASLKFLAWTLITNEKSLLLQAMAWCGQATSHYLDQCWPRGLMLNGVIELQPLLSSLFFLTNYEKRPDNIGISNHSSVFKTSYVNSLKVSDAYMSQ